MPVWDLCFAWDWEHDAGFALLLDAACKSLGLTCLQITSRNLVDELALLGSQGPHWRVLFDRASDAESRYQPLVDWAEKLNIPCINPQKQARWTHDKATMHLEFLTAGLEAPYTMILPPFLEQPVIEPLDLRPLGGQFAIKPACGGGGEGVVLESSTWEQVITARQQYPGEKYLLQAHIAPRLLDDRLAWFRILYCDGAIFSSWWDPHTHIYLPMTSTERFRFNLRGLVEMTRRIASLCCLDLFSTEIALSTEDRCVVVDYVNDPVDLRMQSSAVDGVPDAIVNKIARRLAMLTERLL